MRYFPKFTAMSRNIIVHIKNARLKSCDLSLRLNIPIEKQFLMAGGTRLQGKALVRQQQKKSSSLERNINSLLKLYSSNALKL